MLRFKPPSSSTGQFANCQSSEPSTSNEWLIFWHREKTIRVPTRNGGTATLDIENIRVPDQKLHPELDAIVTLKHGKEFYVMFSPGKVIRRYDKPVLMLPNSRLHGAWWLLD